MSWYLDMAMVGSYWGAERKYHHTAPINMIYALREALRIIAEEGLEARFARHRLNHLALVAGVEAMGLSMLVPRPNACPCSTRSAFPKAPTTRSVRAALLKDFGIEIGGGLARPGRQGLARGLAHGPPSAPISILRIFPIKIGSFMPALLKIRANFQR